MNYSTSASKPNKAMSPIQRIALATIGLAQFAIAMDFTIVYVAMPTIGVDLYMDPAILQWLVTAYSLPFAGFLLLGGKVVDRSGAREVFIAGISVFGAASLIAGVANADWAVITGRTLQGFSAAFLSPAILSLLSVRFPTGILRTRAYSTWGAVGASGLAAGVVLGGFFTDISWRIVFLINIPVVLFCLAGARKMGSTPTPYIARATLPLSSTLLGIAATLLILVTLTLSAGAETDPIPLIIIAIVALAALTLFLINERRSATPLIDRPLRRIKNLQRGAVAAALYMSSVGTKFFIITLFLQDQRDYSPLAAGIAFLPLAVLVTLGNVWAGRLLKTWGASRVLMVGFALSMTGLLLLATMLNVDSYLIGLLPGFVTSGLGHGMIFTSVFVLGNTGVPNELSGAAGAVLTSAQYLSNAVGIAILTLIITNIAGIAGYAWAFGFNTVVASAGVVLAIITSTSTRKRVNTERRLREIY